MTAAPIRLRLQPSLAAVRPRRVASAWNRVGGVKGCAHMPARVNPLAFSNALLNPFSGSRDWGGARWVLPRFAITSCALRMDGSARHRSTRTASASSCPVCSAVQVWVGTSLQVGDRGIRCRTPCCGWWRVTAEVTAVHLDWDSSKTSAASAPSWPTSSGRLPGDRVRRPWELFAGPRYRCELRADLRGRCGGSCDSRREPDRAVAPRVRMPDTESGHQSEQGVRGATRRRLTDLIGVGGAEHHVARRPSASRPSRCARPGIACQVLDHQEASVTGQ